MADSIVSSPEHEFDLYASNSYAQVFNDYLRAFLKKEIKSASNHGKEAMEEAYIRLSDRWSSAKRQEAFNVYISSSLMEPIKKTTSLKDDEIASLKRKLEKERDASLKAGKMLMNQSKMLLNHGAPTPKRKIMTFDDESCEDGEEGEDEKETKRKRESSDDEDIRASKKTKRSGKTSLKKTKTVRDENKPRGQLTAYMIYCNDFREATRTKLLASLERTPKHAEIMKELGIMWNKLLDSDVEEDIACVQKYKLLSENDKKRYRAEMAKYVRPSDEELLKRKADKKRVKSLKKTTDVTEEDDEVQPIKGSVIIEDDDDDIEM